MTPYRVRIYCRDCTGQDTLGCFDGGTDLLPSEFPALVDAHRAGQAEAAKSGPWEYEILQGDRVIFDSAAGHAGEQE